jgi:hypothetical protein
LEDEVAHMIWHHSVYFAEDQLPKERGEVKEGHPI